jgi:hypothetical protein
MVELFEHIRMIYEREKPRMALETGFPKFVTPFTGNADTFISTVLEPIVDAALLLSRPDMVETQFGAAAAKAVRSLDRIDNKDWMPPALLRLWRRKEGDGPAIAAFLIELERLAYYLFVTRQGVNERMARFAGVMDEFDPRPGREKPGGGLSLAEAEQREFTNEL